MTLTYTILTNDVGAKPRLAVAAGYSRPLELVMLTYHRLAQANALQRLPRAGDTLSRYAIGRTPPRCYGPVPSCARGRMQVESLFSERQVIVISLPACIFVMPSCTTICHIHPGPGITPVRRELLVQNN